MISNSRNGDFSFLEFQGRFTDRTFITSTTGKPRPHTFFFLVPPYWNIPGYQFDFKTLNLKSIGLPKIDVQEISSVCYYLG